MAGCVSSRFAEGGRPCCEPDPIADTEYAATAADGAFAEKMSSASLTMASKVSLLKEQCAIPALTFPGSWRFHKAKMMSGQQTHDSGGLHLARSVTKALAS